MTETVIGSVGSVSSLRRYPVKSMLGEALDVATVVGRRVVGDRRYALIDDETSKVVSVKRPARWGRMFELAATTGSNGDVFVTFPDGGAIGVEDPGLCDRLSEFFGRPVSVASSPSPGAMFDEAWERDLKDGAGPYFGAPSRTDDDVELIDGGTFMSEHGNFFNSSAVHLVTTGSTRRLSRFAPGSRFDPHRFRPNIVVDTPEGVVFEETSWQGHTLMVGDVRLRASYTVPRCVMTTLAQEDLPADRDVLRAISEHNSVDVFATATPYPCLGVYADVVTGGTISLGDPVTVVS
ncbi:MAG: MOSC domain-containing protein [Acidimicrobiia bacterium]